MGENKQFAIAFALVGAILIGLGVFWWKADWHEEKIQILNSNSQIKTINTNDQHTKININTASQGELESLPGIGPARAEKIIEGRPYSDKKELIIKKIVGKSVYEQISANIVVE